MWSYEFFARRFLETDGWFFIHRIKSMNRRIAFEFGKVILPKFFFRIQFLLIIYLHNKVLMIQILGKRNCDLQFTTLEWIEFSTMKVLCSEVHSNLRFSVFVYGMCIQKRLPHLYLRTSIKSRYIVEVVGVICSHHKRYTPLSDSTRCYIRAVNVWALKNRKWHVMSHFYNLIFNFVYLC